MNKPMLLSTLVFLGIAFSLIILDAVRLTTRSRTEKNLVRTARAVITCWNKETPTRAKFLSKNGQWLTADIISRSGQHVRLRRGKSTFWRRISS